MLSHSLLSYSYLVIFVKITARLGWNNGATSSPQFRLSLSGVGIFSWVWAISRLWLLLHFDRLWSQYRLSDDNVHFDLLQEIVFDKELGKIVLDLLHIKFNPNNFLKVKLCITGHNQKFMGCCIPEYLYSEHICITNWDHTKFHVCVFLCFVLFS